MASSTHHCLSLGDKLQLAFWSPGPLVVILLFLIHHILEFWHCSFHHYSDTVRINKINNGSFLKVYSSSYVFLNQGCLSDCQLPQNYLLFIQSTEKEYAFVHVGCINTDLQYVHGKPLTISLKCSKSNHLPPGYSLVYMALHVSMCMCACL